MYCFNCIYRDQESILADLRVDIALQYNFLFSETQVEVISGKQEGVYAWIGVNYALHKFDHISTGCSLLSYSVKLSYMYLNNE